MLSLTKEQINFLEKELKTLKVAEKQITKFIELLGKLELTSDQIFECFKDCSVVELGEITEKLTKLFKLENVNLVSTPAQSAQKSEVQEQETEVKKTILIKPFTGNTIPLIPLVKKVVDENGGEKLDILKANNLIKSGGEILTGIASGKAEEIKKQLTEKGLEVEIKT
jgi:ribosomal protein L7/L12